MNLFCCLSAFMDILYHDCQVLFNQKKLSISGSGRLRLQIPLSLFMAPMVNG